MYVYDIVNIFLIWELLFDDFEFKIYFEILNILSILDFNCVFNTTLSRFCHKKYKI